MKKGDFLVAKQTCSIDILCGTGILSDTGFVRKLNMKKNHKYFIASVDNNGVEIIYDNTTIWFSLKPDVHSYMDYYGVYFYDFITSNRREKLKVLKNIK